MSSNKLLNNTMDEMSVKIHKFFINLRNYLYIIIILSFLVLFVYQIFNGFNYYLSGGWLIFIALCKGLFIIQDYYLFGRHDFFSLNTNANSDMRNFNEQKKYTTNNILTFKPATQTTPPAATQTTPPAATQTTPNITLDDLKELKEQK